jgi:glutathione S-transferase
MPAAKIILYSDAFWISPWVFTAHVALREKGASFDVSEVSLEADEQKREGYKATTLTGRVPAMEHGGFWLAESIAIIEYLEELFPGAPSLWPRALQDRAHARQLCSWIRSLDTWPIADERPTSTMFYERATAPLSDVAKRAVTKLFEVAGRFVPAGRPDLFDAWCIADAELAFILHRLILNGHDVPARLRAYAEAQWKRPSVAEWVGHTRKPFAPYG